MIVYSLLGITLLVAALSVRWLYTAARQPVRLIAGLALAVFILLYGAWVFVSIYMQWMFATVAIAALVAGLLRKRVHAANWRPWGLIVPAVVFSLLDVLYFTGTARSGYPVLNLSLPFRQGRYFVFQGGRGLPTNLLHAFGRGHIHYAMDIIKLDGLGRRGNAVFSTKLSDYAIYGDTILAPCTGKVIMAINDNPDNTPPNAIRGLHNTNGVVIDAGTYYVCMVHMKYNDVWVQPGDSVRTGQPIGRVGNSGKSIEPHLHIQAHAKTTPGRPWYFEPPLEIAFNGRTYRLFEVIE